MDWGKVRFFLGEVWASFTRNGPMQLTAIGTVAITIVTLGSFLYVRDALESVGRQFLGAIEISVFLSDKIDDAGALSLRSTLRKDPRIASVVFVPRAEGLRQLRARLNNQVDTSLLTSNPLPNALRVKVHVPQNVSAVAAHIAQEPGVANVNYAKDAVRRLLLLSEVMARVGLGAIIAFGLCAAVIISNTIRLTILARRREISIMQLVGATNMYIRGPFLCEGLIDGVLGAALALGLLELARIELLPKFASSLPFIPLANIHINAAALAIQLLAIGAGVGVLAAWISVGRYLRA